jgi:hypothetical protein
MTIPPIAIEVIADHMQTLVNDVAAAVFRLRCPWCYVGHTPVLDQIAGDYYHWLDVGGSESVYLICEASKERLARDEAVSE